MLREMDEKRPGGAQSHNQAGEMDVVKETFSAQFETIKQAILSCDFVAIDTELTGLSASKKARINSLDSVEERYVRAHP
jgi:DNA polymerase III epsilon subunit-like protein